jgi:hypothetical protein
MTYWEWFSLIIGSAILISLTIILSSWWGVKATRALIREMRDETGARLNRVVPQGEE